MCIGLLQWAVCLCKDCKCYSLCCHRARHKQEKANYSGITCEHVFLLHKGFCKLQYYCTHIEKFSKIIAYNITTHKHLNFIQSNSWQNYLPFLYQILFSWKLKKKYFSLNTYGKNNDIPRELGLWRDVLFRWTIYHFAVFALINMQFGAFLPISANIRLSQCKWINLASAMSFTRPDSHN